MLNKIQSLIDAGNTVVYQCVRYKYAFVIARVITKQDKDLSVGFKSAGHYDDPQRSDSKISIGGPTAESKLFLVQTGDKEYEVFDTEKNYRTGKRVNKPVDFQENVSNLKFESVRPITEVNAEM